MDLHQFCPWDGQEYEGSAPFCATCRCPRNSGDRWERYRPPWRKILYEEQPYDDNYTDDTFLDALVTNPNFVERDFWSVVLHSLLVSQQVCTVVLLVLVATYSMGEIPPFCRTVQGHSTAPTEVNLQQFEAIDEMRHPGTNGTGAILGETYSQQLLTASVNLRVDSSPHSSCQCPDRRSLHASTLLLLDFTLLLLGSASLLLINSRLTSSSSGNEQHVSNSGYGFTVGSQWRYIRSTSFNGFLFFGGTYALSPILQTLARSISSDTICTSTIFLFLIHLFFHDYSYSHLITAKFSGSVSLMSGIFASILLASRLQSHISTFGFVLFTLELLVLFPVVSHHMKIFSESLHLAFSLATVVLTTALLRHISTLLTGVFLIVIFCITIICPYWLIRLQELKFEITGPWDEAKLVTTSGRIEMEDS